LNVNLHYCGESGVGNQTSLRILSEYDFLGLSHSELGNFVITLIYVFIQYTYIVGKYKIYLYELNKHIF